MARAMLAIPSMTRMPSRTRIGQVNGRQAARMNGSQPRASASALIPNTIGRQPGRVKRSVSLAIPGP
jgi:hypothetical protein